jgi:oligopeptide/dipeptide ABC transporter ATP-binding protein
MNPLLDIESVSVHFPMRMGMFSRPVSLRAVEGVSLSIGDRETLALVGESGSGKTTLGHVVAGLRVPSAGRLMYRGAPLVRRRQAPIQIVFQDPFSALNPRMLVSDIVAEPLRLAGGFSASDRLERVAALLAQVGLSRDSLMRYPHEFSGGQRQRIAIARALISDPELIVADEPMSALDVSIQSQILNLLKEIQDGRKLSYLFISHDLALVHHLADRVAVLYLGRLMEVAGREDLFSRPSHPYTRALLESVPRIGQGRLRRIPVVQGEIPSPLAPPSGCVFHTRCPKAQDICRITPPQLLPAPGRETQFSACHFRE